MIRGRHLFCIFGFGGVSQQATAVVVVLEAAVGDRVFAHDVGAGDEIHPRRKILVAPRGLRGSTKRQRWEGYIRDKEESSIIQHCSNGDFDWPLLESKFGAIHV